MNPPVTVYPGYHLLSQILKDDEDKKRKFEDRLYLNTWAPYDTRIIGPWTHNKEADIVSIELFDERAISMNLQNYIIKEALGIGPSQYCVFVHRSPLFNSKLKLLLTYLPAAKMFFYPIGATLVGEFLEPPWLNKVQAINA